MTNHQRSGCQPEFELQPRRDFMRQVGVLALTASGAPLASGKATAAGNKKPPETLVKMLYDSLKGKQRKEVCFDWNHIDKTRGLASRKQLEDHQALDQEQLLYC